MSRLFKRPSWIKSKKCNLVILTNMKKTALLEDSGIRVAGMTLDYIFRSQGLSQVDLLKMNIEGAERLALSGMGEMARKTKNVCISCHDFLADLGGPNELRTKADVISYLKQNGFTVVLRESDGRCNVRDYVYGLNTKLLADSQAYAD